MERKNVVEFQLADGLPRKITFLEETVFRYDVDSTGKFEAYAAPREEGHTARIQQRPDKE